MNIEPSMLPLLLENIKPTATKGKAVTTEIYDHSRNGFWEFGLPHCWFLVGNSKTMYTFTNFKT